MGSNGKGVLLLLASILSGCANLRVEVDIYDGPLVDRSKLTIAELVNADDFFKQNTRNQLFGQYLADVGAQVETIHTQIYQSDPDTRTDAASFAAQDRAAAEHFVREEWRFVDAAAALVKRLADEFADAKLNNQSAFVQEELAQRLRFAVEQYLEAADFFQSNVVGFLAANISAPSLIALPIAVFQAEVAGRTAALVQTDARIAANLARIAASDNVLGRVVGYPIFDPDIKNLEKQREFWKPFVRNTFSANWGSAQFVVVRDGLVVYRQKSLDFDPTPVAGAATALTKLGLKVAAARAVGSYSRTTSSSGTSQLADTTVVDLAQLDALSRAAEVRDSATIQLLNSLAILHQRLSDNATPTDSDLTSYREELQSLLAFYNGQLSAVKISND